MVANMVPVFAARYNWLPMLARPLDGGITWRGQRLLGSNKTWRGLILGVLFGGVTAFFIAMPIAAGLALGFGALAGDAGKSFLKRRLRIAPGRQWFVADQIDFVIGAAVVGILFLPITFTHVVIAVAIAGVGSFVTSYIGVLFGIKKSL